MRPAGLILPDASTLRALSVGPANVHRRGWQCHHLLPRALSRHRQLADFLAGLEGNGPLMSARTENTLWLPATESAAAATGMALHRGPHPHYNAVVAERLQRVRVTSGNGVDAKARISRLQKVLTATLSGQAPTALRLNRLDPMRLFADYSSLDDAIATLLTDQPR